MQILRTVILVLFVFLFNLLFPAISKLLDPTLQKEAAEAYPSIIGAVAFGTLFILALLFVIHWIDKIEQERDNKRIAKIVEEVFKNRNKKRRI